LDPSSQTSQRLLEFQFGFFIFSQAHQSEGKGHTGIHQHIYREGNTKVARAALCIHWDHIWAACFLFINHQSRILFALHTLTNPFIRLSLAYLPFGSPFDSADGFLIF
jgi:hypothetical protein